MDSGVLAGLAKGETNYVQPTPIITTNIQYLSYTAPGDPYFNYVTLLLSDSLISGKEFHFANSYADRGSKLNSNGTINTYSLIYTSGAAVAYVGAVVDNLGDIHFSPRSADRGQKISPDGAVSTYNFVYTVNGGYSGGVFLPGTKEAHFVPFSAAVGQKITSSGIVSTYSLIYTTSGAYNLGVLAPNGDLHFVPFRAAVGQKINSSGTISTYSLVYTSSNDSYAGGVVAPNGDIHFIPRSAPVGQKVSPDGTVSTYSLIFTGTNAYFGGVLAANGDIHFVPSAGGVPPSLSTIVGQKIGSDTIVSTYSLPYTTTNAYVGGVLLDNGDLHFTPFSAAVGTKISSSGTVSTYSLTYTTAFAYSDGASFPFIASNNTFLDNRLPGFAITRNGNVTQGSFSPYGTTWSNYFDGTGDYLTVANNTALQMGSGDFTIEFWIHFNSISSYQTLFDKGYTETGGLVIQTGNGNGRLIIYASGSAVITETGTASIGVWIHYALVRSGTTLTLYQNGVSSGSATNSTNFNNANQVAIGAAGTAGAVNIGDYAVNGYISNLRVVKGTAVYTATFTVPTAPLTAITNTSLLTCQSNRFLDASTNAFAVTKNGDVSVQEFSPFGQTSAYSVSTFGGSGYFDGNGDYLSAQSSADFNFGTGNYCIEAWVYLTTITSGYTLLFSSSGVNNYWGIRDVGGIGWLTSYNGSSVFEQSSTNYFQLRAWQHIAYVKNNNTYSMYLNGVSVYSISDTSSWGATGAFNIGASPTYYGANYQANGYVSNVRVVKGSPVYTANFTPPTALLTTVNTTTSLLLNFTNQAIIDSSMNNVIETVGNARLSNVQKKWTNRSIFFDGNGDYLTLPTSPQFGFGTGDFTIEGWIYPTAFGGTNSVIIDFRSGSEPSVKPDWEISSSGIINYRVNGSTVITGSTISTNTWSHVALCRGSGVTRIFVNGIQVGSNYTDTNNYGQTSRCWIGADDDGSPNAYFIGYIDDLRITKGIARYTDTFTPPTGPHPRYITDYSNLLMIEYLVVAGGGNGSVFSGGGAGGMRSGILYISSGTAHQVTVGAGGGNNSIFSNIISTGGGFGGGFGAGANGGNGGSGGGAGYVSPVSTNIGTGIYGEGNNGGDQAGGYGGGGGGGRAAVGGNATGSSPNITAGAGGAGAASAITGTNFTYAGGGGGGAYSPGVIAAGAGGVGGGGAGGLNATGSAGIANTGGGGGGSGNYGGGGSGGSGIVIIAYPSSRPVLSNIDVGLTHTVSTSTRAGYRVYRFTGGTGTITF